MAEIRTTPSTAPAGAPNVRNGWRGAAPAEAPRHRWQQGAQGTGGGRLLDSRPVRKIRVAAWFLAALTLMLLLAYYLLYSPEQTPLLTVVATGHRRPIPPNAWATEDAAALRELTNQTLQVTDISGDWASQEHGLKRLGEELATLVRRHNRSKSLVLYLSLPGAIDGEGRPCLLTSDADPQDSATWLPLERVFAQIREAKLPSRVHKLIVLDCTRELVDWNLGQAYSGFADALPQAVADAKIPNLAILNSTSPGQSAAASPWLRGSVFGHYFRLALAGAADHGSQGGNNSGSVSLSELRDYLQGHVHGWTMHHLGRSQLPQVIPEGANFEVAWGLRSSDIKDPVIEAADPVVPAAEIAQLWSKLGTLRAARPWRFDPVGWRTLSLDLLRLEQFAVAGKAYDKDANQLRGELANRLQQAEERRQVAAQSGSLPAFAGILDGSTAPPLKMHSLPLAALWGSTNADTLRSLNNELSRITEEPNPANLAAVLAASDAANLPVALDEVNFLAIWQRLAVPGAWRDPAPLALAWQLHTLAQKHASPLPLAGLPGDERASAWVRGQLAPLDAARRELEDAVLVGPAQDNALAPGDDTRQELAGFTLGERITRALALRDDLWAELPHLASWLCRPQEFAEAEIAADRLIDKILQPLLADAIHLEQELERTEQGQLAWNADALVASVDQKLTDLRGEFDRQVKALMTVSEGDDADGQRRLAAAAREIDAILALPIVTWDQRQRLREKRHELHTKLMSGYDIHDGAGLPQLPSGRARGHLERMTHWRPHPLAVLLDHDRILAPANKQAALAAAGDVLEPTPLAAITALNEAAREQLSALARGPAKSLVSGEAAAPADLQSLCRAESRLRTAAALWFEAPGVDPVRELRRADLAQLFLWQAQRTIDDFYGPARSGGEPFFAASAADYLAAARSFGPLTAAADAQATALDRRLSRGRIAAREALGMTATDILLVEQSATVESSLDVRARTPEAAADLPHATAAVFLADQIGRLGPPGWPLPLPPTDSKADQAILSQHTTLDTAGLKSRGPLVQAVASLRGNDFAAPLLLRAPGGLRVDFRPPVFGPPQVTVLGFDRKKASVVFILDCSHSMKAGVNVERPDDAVQPEATRMEVAKGALRSLLGEMAARGDLRVGVRLFGHRVGWSTTEAEKLLRQTTYADEIPAELRPYGDVQEILDLGRFDSIAAGKVFDKLATVKPWGESPIYLALQQAVSDFGPDDNSARSIVLITDGQNSQFNPPREFAPALNDVLSAAERAGVAIHVVGFDIQQGEAATASRDFEQAATRTGGSFVPAKDATALIDTLQRLLRPGEFRVADANGTVVAEAEIGRSVTLRNHRGRRDYGVSYENLREPVELFGGEAVELTIRRGSPRLEVVPYLKGNPQPQSMIVQEDGAATPLVAWMHRSVRVPEGIKFPISIQNADGHFVPRPVEMWVQIAPLGLPPQQDPGPYIFYDAPLEPGTSVPLANFLATNWPPAATKAEIRVWAKSTATEPTQTRPLSDVADRLPAEGSGFEIPGIAGVTYQVRTVGGSGQPLSVGLIERHDERSPGVGSLKVTLSPQATRVTHQFDAANRLVLHTFTYEQPAEDLRGRIAVQFTPRDLAQSRSWRTAQPAIVDVSDRQDLLEVSPPVNGNR